MNADDMKAVETNKCGICYEQKPKTLFTILTCRHSFCKNCLRFEWTENIKAKKVFHFFKDYLKFLSHFILTLNIFNLREVFL